VVVLAESLLRESDSSVLVASLSSLTLSSSYASTVVQHGSRLGLFKDIWGGRAISLFTMVKHISLDLELCIVVMLGIHQAP
jgi:hypothetical protein